MLDGPLVFLSSTCEDLLPYRESVVSAISETEFFRIVAQENFGILANYPKDVCEDRVLKCDIFVAIVGHYRGSEIARDGSLRSFTEYEYDIAVGAQKPRFVALQPEEHEVKVKYVSRGPEGERQIAFRRRISEDEVVGLKFGSPDKVALQVVNALWKYEHTRGKKLATLFPATETGTSSTKD